MTDLHVLPLPKPHESSPNCWCHPILSRAGLIDIYIHRLDDNIPLRPPVNK